MKILAEKRQVPVKYWRILAEYAEFEKRQWIVDFMLLAEKNNGILNKKKINEEFGIDEAIGQNIIRRFQELGLIKDERLTDLGKTIITTEKTPVFKKSPLIVEFCEDPVLELKNPFFSFSEELIKQDPEIIFKTFEHTLENVPNLLKNKNFWNTRIQVQINHIAKDFDPQEKPSSQESNEILIKEICDKGEAKSNTKTISIKMSLDSEKFDTVKICIDGDQIHLDWDISAFSGMRFFDQIRQELTSQKRVLAFNESKNQPDIFQALVSYDSTELVDRINFRKNYLFQHISIKDLGEFDVIEVQEVPIYPYSQKDAGLWAKSLLLDRISGHIQTNQYDALKNKVIEYFSITFKMITLPTQGELAQEVYNQEGYSRKYWYLQSSLDLLN